MSEITKNEEAVMKSRKTTIGELKSDNELCRNIAWVFSKAICFTDLESGRMRNAEKFVTEALHISVREFRDLIKAYL